MANEKYKELLNLNSIMKFSIRLKNAKYSTSIPIALKIQ